MSRNNFDPPASYYEPPEGKTYYCPVCGEEVGLNDDYFKNDYTGEIVGCSSCVRPADIEEVVGDDD